MKIKRLFTAAASVAIAAVFGCALFFSCGNPGNGETLRWRSTIDIPVNDSFYILIPQHVKDWLNSNYDTIVPLGLDTTHTVPVNSDIIDFLRKFTDHETYYQLDVINKTGLEFTLYALLFQKNDSAVANIGTEEFRLLLTRNNLTELADNNRISLLHDELGNTSGLVVPGNGEPGRARMPDVLSAPLCSLILKSEESLMWRWLALINTHNQDNQVATDTIIHARLRLRISGVNSFDSLLAM